MNRLLPPYVVPQERRPTRAALVPKIRPAVDQWRAGGYPGVTDTTRRLLQYWFQEDHRVRRGGKAQEFGYYFCQREAIETLIYLLEVRQLRSMYELVRNFPPDHPMPIDPAQDLFPRYVFKMATGSGKTKVMSLAVVWSYFNAVFEPNSPLPRTFLLIAPNVIVYERLKVDFEAGRIFNEDPIVPPEWKADWQMTVVLRDSPSRSATVGSLYLTNVQRLYDAPQDRSARNETPEMIAMLGPRVRESASITGEALRDLVLGHRELMVINDEGHHLHNEDLEWHKVIAGLHDSLQARGRPGLACQLDFTATPKHQNGALFREIVVDYPVAQAVEDGIVKRPILGELKGAVEYTGKKASVIYRDRLTAGVQKWREYWEKFQETQKKPVLFVMAEDTEAADDIAGWLEQQNPFAGHVLNIHTNRSGEINETKGNQSLIEYLRDAARKVDGDDNPYRAIVSVLMLREGWDVRNVVVIVPLRPYTAKAQILPEQTLGRGLRRITLPGSGVDERVIVIEHEAFKPFWKKELDEEGLEVEWQPVEAVHPDFKTVYVDKTKLQYDISVPLLSPALVTTTEGLENLSVSDLAVKTVSAPQLHLIKEDTFEYTGRDMLTLEVVDRDQIERSFPADSVGYVVAMCHLIEKECHLTGHFHRLAGLVKEYIETVLFGEKVDMENEEALVRLNKPDAKIAIFEAFVQTMRGLSVKSQIVQPTGEELHFSNTDGYEWSRPVYSGQKTIFNLVACDVQFETEFASFLDRASDVAAYVKNNMNAHFSIEYQSRDGGIRLYYPDFVVRMVSGEMWLLETKGVEDVEVAQKDARAAQWCKDATIATGISWDFEKVPYAVFQGSSASTIEELIAEIKLRNRS
ncbi:MAG: DEAD/DEAH box helicase family protein [Chloroflexi bacterium]|nr:DEAD/DEAH box helicase family protein [Chloroflexota bacterium]